MTGSAEYSVSSAFDQGREIKTVHMHRQALQHFRNRGSCSALLRSRPRKPLALPMRARPIRRWRSSWAVVSAGSASPMGFGVCGELLLSCTHSSCRPRQQVLQLELDHWLAHKTLAANGFQQLGSVLERVGQTKMIGKSGPTLLRMSCAVCQPLRSSMLMSSSPHRAGAAARSPGIRGRWLPRA